MSDLLAPIIYVFVDETRCYFAYSWWMNVSLKINFDNDQSEMIYRSTLLENVLSRFDRPILELCLDYESNLLHLFYRHLLLNCKREFTCFDDILRTIELTLLCSLENDLTREPGVTISREKSSLFVVCLSAAVLVEDRREILSFSNDEQFHRYFYRPSGKDRCSSSARAIIRRAQQLFSLSNDFSVRKQLFELE